MVGTLDNCLTRLGQRESAAAVREFAVGAGNITSALTEPCTTPKSRQQAEPLDCVAKPSSDTYAVTDLGIWAHKNRQNDGVLVRALKTPFHQLRPHCDTAVLLTASVDTAIRFPHCCRVS